MRAEAELKWKVIKVPFMAERKTCHNSRVLLRKIDLIVNHRASYCLALRAP